MTSIQDRVELARALLNEDRHRSGTSDFRTPVEEITQRVSDLVDAYSTPLESNIQLHIFQVVSSIRSILTDANIVNKESPLLKIYPELSRQRKAVLGTLSQLVLKGKDIQSVSSNENMNTTDERETNQISYLADQLLNEVEIFDKLLTTLPRYSTATSESTVYTRPSSMFQNDTPRSSFSSLGHSSITSLNSLRQHITEVRHSSASLVAKSVHTTSVDQTLQSVFDHQTSIRDLINELVVTLENFLFDRKNATDILEVTRKAVEAIRTFLAIAEHVYSDIDTEHNQYSAIPKDPQLASLVLTKESVYSAITNLVTAVRALTGPRDSENLKRDFDHLKSCCENVVNSTEECTNCIRACLEEFKQNNDSQLVNNKSENSGDAGRLHVLNALGRKAVTLTMLQNQYNPQESKSSFNEQEQENDDQIDERDIESLEIGKPSNTFVPAAASVHTDEESSMTPESYDDEEDAAQTHYIKSSISDPSLRLNIPEVDSRVRHIRNSNESLQRNNSIRSRASSMNTAQILINQLPPAPPPKTTMNTELASADPFLSRSNTPASQQNETDPSNRAPSGPKDIFRSRRPRVLSISSILPSINKSKSERVTTTTPKPMLPENFRPRNTPLWTTMGETTSSLKVYIN